MQPAADGMHTPPTDSTMALAAQPTHATSPIWNEDASWSPNTSGHTLDGDGDVDSSPTKRLDLSPAAAANSATTTATSSAAAAAAVNQRRTELQPDQHTNTNEPPLTEPTDEIANIITASDDPHESEFDPARSSTPHATSPPFDRHHGGTQVAGGGGSGSSSVILPVPSKPHLPILSLPALVGQRVCPCMRAVEEGSSGPLQPTQPGPNNIATNTTLASPSPPMPTPSIDRLISLQDRFWLSVGEVAMHNDDHSVERGVDSMETLAVKLTHLSQQLDHRMSFLRDQQLRGVDGIMVELERKNSELVEFLKQTRLEESAMRERIDAISVKVEKAKKTVSMGGTLGLASAKQQRERAHLDAMRAARDDAQRQLETIVTNRTLSQNQMLNVSTIAAECRITDMDKRDYKLMYKQVQSPFFHRSFGPAYQSQCDTMVKVLSRFRDQSHECLRRQRLIEHTILEIRGRIALVVSAYWK